MKKRIFLSWLIGVYCVGLPFMLSAGSFETGLKLPLEKDSKPWTLGGSRLETDEKITFLLREGESLEEWTEIIVMREQPHSPNSPGTFRRNLIRALKEEYGRSSLRFEKTSWNKKDGSCLFVWHKPEEMEVVKALKKPGQGFAVVTYTTKDYENFKQQRALYKRIFSEIKQTGERVEVMGGIG